MKPVDEYLSKISSTLKEKFKAIKFIIFDFDGVFTDNNVYTDQNGNESVISSKFDGFGLKKLKDLGIDLFILSTEKNTVVEKRAKKLEIGFLQGLSSDEKATELHNLVENGNFNYKSVAYMGNDINDIQCLVDCGLAIVVNDCHPEVIKYADYVTDTNGGHGAVREVCDIIEALKK
ncbi:MAG: KdsC family phosphatase [Dehalococcoidia bacterium]|nr:HAD hydrolase family protein [Chloroflexota bacterium]|tara:strand:- start:342 stop:869 length:528 start_codon:yes stop_codon:yes gene_type:complete